MPKIVPFLFSNLFFKGPSAADNQEAYQDLLQREQKLHKQVLKLSEENIEMKFEVEQAQKDIPRLKERIQDLGNYIDVLKNEMISCINVHCSFNSGIL